MRKPEYGPRPRFVVELTKPKIVAMYMNGEEISPAVLKASVDTKANHVSISVEHEEVEFLTGMDYDYGPFDDMEILFVDDGT